MVDFRLVAKNRRSRLTLLDHSQRSKSVLVTPLIPSYESGRCVAKGCSASILDMNPIPRRKSVRRVSSFNFDRRKTRPIMLA